MTDPRALAEAFHGLVAATLAAADWLKAHGIAVPDDVVADLAALKTEAYYQRTLTRAVRDLFAGKIDESQFIDIQIRLVEEQLTRAWRGGARDVGVMPEDMTDEDLAELQAIIDNEQEYILAFAADILAARQAGGDIEPLLARAELWVNRYNDVYNRAKVYFGGRNKLVWNFGDTIHCNTCAALNGIVAYAQEWEESGVRPQSPPNDKIECGGWKCQCTLDPTEDRRTPNALSRIREIAKK